MRIYNLGSGEPMQSISAQHFQGMYTMQPSFAQTSSHHLRWGGLVLGIFFWILIIWLVVALFHLFTRGSRRHCSGEGCGEWFRKESTPNEKLEVKSDSRYVQIVKERYAKGEINKEEFEQKLKDLM